MPALSRLLLPVLACAVSFVARAEAAPADPLQGASQVVVVTTADWQANQGRLRTYERDAQGQWHATGPGWAVAIGRNGSAWGDGLQPQTEQEPRKREGDGRSPAGVFALGTAFGYAARVDSKMAYQQMQADDWCMDVPTSPLYNRIVSAAKVGQAAVQGSSEAMRLDLHHDGDPRYGQGFVIEHNAAAVPGRGSCIFGHLWRKPGETTAGCTAMDPANMQRLLGWLQPARQPRFVLLPAAEYRRLQASWQLPAGGEAP